MTNIDFVSEAESLRSEGTILLPMGAIFVREELETILELQASIPEEIVSSGDDDIHKINVRRLVTDKVGQPPTLVNRPASDRIISIIDDEKRRSLFGDILGVRGGWVIRRCQLHRMSKGSYIGAHVDAESNPDNEFAVTVQLGRSFTGGEFVVHPPNRNEQVFETGYGSVLVTSCQLRHEVRRVLSHERISLTYFYSRYAGPNKRDPHARCTRPGCRWCGAHLLSPVDGA